jgi:hypothetical protein
MYKKITTLLGSKWFFGLVIAFFVLQAGWLAMSARYPMAFDEAHHVGVIQLYAEQWSPILTQQPDGPAPYGAITVDPSYLYHYLMSFPYRLLNSFVSNPIQVIVYLRLINVVFFAVSLVLFRKVLLKTRASPAVVHITLLFFTMVPVVPLLAAHVNYDNLLILLVALSLLIASKFREQLQKKRQCNAGLMLHVVSFCMLASLVKVAFLPIFLAVAAYLTYILVAHVGPPHKIWRSFGKNWRTLTKFNRTMAMSVFVLSLGLFFQRYGLNVIRYQNITPQCHQLLSVERCMADGPWARNYKIAKNKTLTGGNPVTFLAGWTSGMFYRSFFAINGPGGPSTYDNKPPLPILSATAIAVFGFGAYKSVRLRSKLLSHDPALVFLLFVSFVYIAFLMGKLYYSYVDLGALVAVNGRYLVPIMLPIMLLIGLAYERFLRQRQQIALVIIVFFLFLQGGGALSFIYNSNVNWYRSDSQFVTQQSQRLQRATRPFIVNWPQPVLDILK